AKKVFRKAAGSALLADESHVARILDAVVAAVNVPVTLKIRTGVSPERRNAVTVARLAEDAGIAALAVHGTHPRPALSRRGRIRHHCRRQTGGRHPGMGQWRHRLA